MGAQNGELWTHCQTAQCVSGFLAAQHTITLQTHIHEQAHACVRTHTYYGNLQLTTIDYISDHQARTEELYKRAVYR